MCIRDSSHALTSRYVARVAVHYAVSVKQTMLDAVYFGAISTFLIQTCVSAALLAYGAHLVSQLWVSAHYNTVCLT